MIIPSKECTTKVSDYINKTGLFNTYLYLSDHSERFYGYYPILLSTEMREICKENGWGKAFIFIVGNGAPGYSNRTATTNGLRITSGSLDADFDIKIRFYDYGTNKFDEIGVFQKTVRASKLHSVSSDRTYDDLSNKALRKAMESIFIIGGDFVDKEGEKK